MSLHSADHHVDLNPENVLTSGQELEKGHRSIVGMVLTVAGGEGMWLRYVDNVRERKNNEKGPSEGQLIHTSDAYNYSDSR